MSILIESNGKFTPENIATLIRKVGTNKVLVKECSRIAKLDLPAFIELAFDLDEVGKKALRTVFTERLANAFIEATIDH